jgi:hypothetical protein
MLLASCNSNKTNETVELHEHATSDPSQSPLAPETDEEQTRIAPSNRHGAADATSGRARVRSSVVRCHQAHESDFLYGPATTSTGGMMEVTKMHGEGKQPDGPLFAPQRADDLSSHLLRQAMGYLALFLPAILYLVAGWRSRDGVPGWKLLDSVSQYYYSGSVAVLTGVLWAVAAFLFTYRGYDNPSRRTDVRTGKMASAGALGVAMFPTVAMWPFNRPPWWADWMKYVHYGSALLLFSCLIFYSLVLFPKRGGEKGIQDTGKKKRNLVYRLCGWGMAAAMVWVLAAGLADGPIFIPESLALMLFGVAWLTKGRAWWTLREIAKRL